MNEIEPIVTTDVEGNVVRLHPDEEERAVWIDSPDEWHEQA